MKKILPFILMALLISLVACGGGDSTPEGDGQTDSDNTSNRPTPTQVVLETPTPKPAPATPTSKPATATPEPAAAEPTEAPTEEVMVAMVETEMILIPAGSFTMGSDSGDGEDGPAHSVDLPAFEMDKFEVTNEDFAKFIEATGYKTYTEETGGQTWLDYANNKGNHPVVKVTWNDAVAFCEWAEKRLPTEEEWEKAARGEDGRAYPWGNDFDSNLANVKDTAIRGTTAVGSFPEGASPYGVEDIAGNVWEWTSTWYKAYPGSTYEDRYFGEDFRVTRGGAWFEEAPQVTVFNRNAGDPDTTANDDVGFRCVRDAK